jgi:thiol:disulfide interchange protein DsbD
MLEGLLSYTEISLEKVTLLSYMVIFFGGVLTSFTPCVYPIIPVTVSFIGASASQSKARAFLLSLSYVFGIAFSYSALGAFAALAGKLFGEISSSPWTFLAVGNVFLILGLSMLDVFSIPIPGLSKAKGPVSKPKGLIGAFLVGVSAGFVIGPCTAPALGAVLAYVASRQNIFLGVSLLFTFAFGMGILLIIIGTFTGIAASLPKSGRWLDAVRKVFGVILILCAEYFIIMAGKRF